MSRTGTVACQLRTAALLAALVAAAYGNSLAGSFHYDDFHSLVDNPHVRDLANAPRYFLDPSLFSADADKAMYRPLLLLTYGLNHALLGGDLRGYHVVNALLHLGCVLLLWRLARALDPGPGWLASAAAALFAVHPVASEPVNYISSRSESLAALWLLAALLAHLRAEGDRRWLAASLPLFALALLSKETALALPLLLVLREAQRRVPGGLAAAALRLAPYAAVTAGYLAILSASRLLPGGRPEPGRDLSVQLATQLKAVPFYLQRFGVPVRLSVDPAFTEGNWDRAAVAVAALLAASLVGLALRAGGWRWWLLWPLLVALPASAVPLNVLVNEHRVYLAAAGLCVPLALAAGRSGRRRWPALALLAVWCLLTVQRNGAWATERTLWEDAVAKGPGQARGRVHLGNALRAEGKRAEARHQFERALAAGPGNLAARTNLANLLYEEAGAATGADARALLAAAAAQYGQVLAAAPDHREALTNLGNVYRALGDTARAAHSYRRAVAAHPNHGDAYANLGDLALAAGDNAAAASWFEGLTGLEPGRASGWRRLGDARALAGDIAAASQAYARACDLDPADAGACYNQAETLRALGERAAAAGDRGAAAAAWRRALSAYERVVAARGDYRNAPAMIAALRRRLEAGR